MNVKMYESEFEEAVIALLQAQGWQYSFGGSLHRKITDTIYEEDLLAYLKHSYADKDLDDSDLKAIVANIKNINGQSDYVAACNAFNLYRDGYDFIYSDSSKTPFKLEYIDFENVNNNIFRVVNQFEIKQANETRIPDVLLFINGIPIGIIELKNPTDENATIRDAHTQITTRYLRDIPSLLKYCAVASISDGSNTRLGTIFTPYEFFYAWKKVDNENPPAKGIAQLETLIKGAFTPDRILEILRDYIYFPDIEEGKEKKLQIICRYPQFFATRKLRESIIKNLKSKGGNGKGGIYFGATGCGKTYTMLFLARQLLLRAKNELGSPTILLIVDREDLENQASKLFCKSTDYLSDKSVKAFESRKELADELKIRQSGGVYITTIQKFTENLGLLSDRSNIICMSDEAHRSQANTTSKLKISKDSNEAVISYGFAKYLRDALPNASYVGFTGTPVDEAIHVFGAIVDQYTMLESQEDGITVPINYDPRLARVFLDSQQAQLIEEYYKTCEDEGASSEDVQKSKNAMSSMKVILGDTDRLTRLAKDLIQDYEARCDNNPNILQKAMLTCSDRNIAYKLYNIIKELKPNWCIPQKSLYNSSLGNEQLEKLKDISFINIVATRSKDDPKEMYDLLGDDDHRKFLDAQYKDENSNFRIAIVVDMWITGFDCPSLTVLYNDKPLQKHTLIQTISRVNRKYSGKEYGYVVDYIGIRENMKKAMKTYGGGNSGTEEDLDLAKVTFLNELQILKEMTTKLDFSPFFGNNPLERLQFLQTASEFILDNSIEEKDKVSFATMFKGHVRRLKSAYDICNPAGILSDEEVAYAQCFMGICAFLRKITDSVHDTVSMNKAVEKMLKEAITCTGVETVLDSQGEEGIFEDKFLEEVDKIKLPNTKFQILLKLLNQAIKEYSKTNKVRATYFTELLNQTVDKYNSRDKLTFTNEVASDTVNAINTLVDEKVSSLTQELIDLFKSLNKDKSEFKELGISFEEKAFYDILINLRDIHKFEYSDDKCICLAKKINDLIANTSIYSDWLNNDNLKNKLASELTYLIYKEGYPPEWDKEIFDKILEQVENFKKNS